MTWGFEKEKGLSRLSDNNAPHKSSPYHKVCLIANKDNQKYSQEVFLPENKATMKLHVQACLLVSTSYNQ